MPLWKRRAFLKVWVGLAERLEKIFKTETQLFYIYIREYTTEAIEVRQ
jgi:hypothetical protein